MSRFKFVIQPADGGGDKKGKQGGWLADRKKGMDSPSEKNICMDIQGLF